MKFEYPVARRDETVVDDYHGVKVPDPYRWLEDPDAEETKEYVTAQNAVTRPYLDSCPYRQKVKDQLSKLWNYQKYSCPDKHGDRYFFLKNTGLQNQSVWYVQDSLEGEARVFYDPNTLSKDGTVAVSAASFSEDGSIFAYGLSSSGSDWITIHFMRVDTGEKLPEVLEKVKYSSICWTHDNKGIFYGCYPEASESADGSETESNSHQKLYYHRIGTSQDQDVLVVEFPEDPLLRIHATVSDCGNWLILTPLKECKDYLLYFCNLKEAGEITGKLKIKQIVHELVADYVYITTIDDMHVFRTNRKAPNYRLIGIDVNQPEEENWKTIVPEHEKDVLYWAMPVNKDQMVICYIQDVKNTLQLHKITGEHILNFKLDVGTIAEFSGKKKNSEMFFLFTSFLTPGTIYHCDLAKTPVEPTIFRETKVEGLDRTKYTTDQVFYPSKDGTKIPMFIVRKKDSKQDASQPCVLYGYGGFNISVQPFFGVNTLLFMQHLNGIVAIANIRGGGEYGEAWHNGGRFGNKQNVFDDFQCAAEYLVKEKYTKSKLLAIQGGSNGGLLVAACINQRPDLFGAALCQVGVLDMLRYHKFTIGYAWVSDYGSSDDPKQFEYLYKYSPLHNTFVPSEEKGQYPATLLFTADHDDRVVPLHSLKFIAQLHHSISKSDYQTNPVMIRVEQNAGHGRGKPTMKLIDEGTDSMCFLIQSLGLKFYD
ncbi:prolyl endopeptidase isoform X2 [Chrysoperla carnea]|nr:prolyl endopeptidase isoform X2 [Chrysoperla carnea]